MIERPIIFSTLMVQALLQGRKTQTRRVMKHQPTDVWAKPPLWVDSGGFFNSGVSESLLATKSDLKCPYGRVGDRLWVREAWAKGEDCSLDNFCSPIYKASWPYSIENRHDAGLLHLPKKWRPSIHMPRWLSRIILEIIHIGVEPVQAITKEDVIREGLQSREGLSIVDVHAGWHEPFADLWDSSNLKRGAGWTTNPYVWVITFKRII